MCPPAALPLLLPLSVFCLFSPTKRRETNRGAGGRRGPTGNEMIRTQSKHDPDRASGERKNKTQQKPNNNIARHHVSFCFRIVVFFRRSVGALSPLSPHALLYIPGGRAAVTAAAADAPMPTRGRRRPPREPYFKTPTRAHARTQRMQQPGPKQAPPPLHPTRTRPKRKEEKKPPPANAHRHRRHRRRRHRSRRRRARPVHQPRRTDA